jgi:hypothetical protein
MWLGVREQLLAPEHKSRITAVPSRIFLVIVFGAGKGSSSSRRPRVSAEVIL